MPRPHPEGALLILTQGKHKVIREALAGGVGGELPVAKAIQPAAGSSHPEVSFAVFEDGQDDVAG